MKNYTSLLPSAYSITWSAMGLEEVICSLVVYIDIIEFLFYSYYATSDKVQSV